MRTMLAGLVLIWATGASALTVPADDDGYQSIVNFDNVALGTTDFISGQIDTRIGGGTVVAGTMANPAFSGTQLYGGTSLFITVGPANNDLRDYCWPDFGAFVTSTAPVLLEISAYAYDLGEEVQVLSISTLGAGTNVYLSSNAGGFYTSARFSSSAYFTIDALALGLVDVPFGIPEPTTWALLIVGFGPDGKPDAPQSGTRLTPPGFTGSPLDRADALRRDAGAVIAARADPRARWLVFEDLKPVLTADGDLLWAYRSDVPHDAVSVFLGLDGDAPRFAAAASAAELDGVPTDARAAGALLAASADPGRAAVVAHGRSLLDWHARHGFCAACGSPTTLAKAGYARDCPACGAEHFPRTDPVVIMLATKGDHALVGRQPRFPRRLFSALAGFVEPGESFEEAVARELYEEAGIAVTNVRYIASQPWPFPSSLMIGAFADATGYELHLDGEELEEARWVTRDEVRAALAGSGDWHAPPPLAIARTLLEEFVAPSR